MPLILIDFLCRMISACSVQRYYCLLKTVGEIYYISANQPTVTVLATKDTTYHPIIIQPTLIVLAFDIVNLLKLLMFYFDT